MYSKRDIFGIIYKHLQQQYLLYNEIKPTANWYTDLKRTEYELNIFYEWVEKEFDIKMPYFYFTNLDDLCDVIYTQIRKRDIKNKIFEFFKQKFSRSK